MLYTKNVQVVSAHSIAEADQCIAANGLPAAIFLDHLLPDGHGIDYANRLRQLSNKIKLIIMTGDDDEKLQQQALAHGCIGFLEKPFSYLHVSELLEKALQKRKSIFRLPK